MLKVSLSEEPVEENSVSMPGGKLLCRRSVYILQLVGWTEVYFFKLVERVKASLCQLTVTYCGN